MSIHNVVMEEEEKETWKKLFYQARAIISNDSL